MNKSDNVHSITYDIVYKSVLFDEQLSDLRIV